MNIIVLATACGAGGTLTIYKQFLYHLPNHIEDNRYYVFVDPTMDQPPIKNVEYIQKSTRSYLRRIYMDARGYMDEMKRRGVTPDAIFSLQNTGCVTNCRQVVYFHQPLPLYPQKWNPFKSAERTMFLYKYFYPYFVQKTLNKKTDIIVQIPFIKKGFMRKFRYDPTKIHIAFPDIENIDVDKIEPHDYANDCYNFIYPASAIPYKNHLTIAKALDAIKDIDENLLNQIRIHFTVKEQDNIELYRYIKEKHLSQCCVFHGNIPHKELMSYYKGSMGLLFPSEIETLGLPLLEAAAFGLPIIAADLDYAHEVIGNYGGVEFVLTNQPDEWAKSIVALCLDNCLHIPIQREQSSWGDIFKIVLSN